MPLSPYFTRLKQRDCDFGCTVSGKSSTKRHLAAVAIHDVSVKFVISHFKRLKVSPPKKGNCRDRNDCKMPKIVHEVQIAVACVTGWLF